jgi:hypothetical protein
MCFVVFLFLSVFEPVGLVPETYPKIFDGILTKIDFGFVGNGFSFGSKKKHQW